MSRYPSMLIFFWNASIRALVKGCELGTDFVNRAISLVEEAIGELSPACSIGNCLYPISAAFLKIKFLVSGDTLPVLLMALEMVFLDKCNSSAMSCMVTLFAI